MSAHTAPGDSLHRRAPNEAIRAILKKCRSTKFHFFMYSGAELDHEWLRNCPRFEEMRRSAYNERLAEVYIRDALAQHPWRTFRAEEAKLIYVPVWEVVSFNVGDCNGTTHSQRMLNTAAALQNSAIFGSRKGGRARSKASRAGGVSRVDRAQEPESLRPNGFSHFMVSSGCIENGKRLRERLSNKLAGLLRAAIVGRDRAYSSFYSSSAVGRCTFEVYTIRFQSVRPTRTHAGRGGWQRAARAREGPRPQKARQGP